MPVEKRALQVKQFRKWMDMFRLNHLFRVVGFGFIRMEVLFILFQHEIDLKNHLYAVVWVLDDDFDLHGDWR